MDDDPVVRWLETTLMLIALVMVVWLGSLMLLNPKNDNPLSPPVNPSGLNSNETRGGGDPSGRD